MKEMRIESIKTSELIPYENNPRNNDEAVEFVANSIKDFGFKVPIIIDKNNVVVAGHTRLKAAELLGLEEVPCIRATDLTDAQIKAFRIADNKTSEKAGWDLDKLKIELEDIEFDMKDFGFGDFELSMLVEDMDPEPYDNELVKEYSEKSDDYLEKKRVIITYKTEEEEAFLKKLLNVDELKVMFRVEEIMDEADTD